ncbi:MAG: VOC family protein [Bacteroidales bacterium]|jgi:lactoylglutathione lyase|nr:VOC family protein [Bacteroidales bacterium]
MLGLRTTIYLVEDLAKAKAWYSKAFKTEPYFDESFYVGFNIGGYELGLMPNEHPEKPKCDNVLSYWGVEDIVLEYKHLIDLGATKHEEPNNVGGELMVATVFDPWGNVVGLIYNPEFKLKQA